MNILSFLAALASSPYFWGSIGIALIISEAFVPGAVLLFLGASALLTALFGFFLPHQAMIFVGCFCLLSIIFLICVRRFYLSYLMSVDAPSTLNNRGQNLIGKHYVLAQGTVNQKGRIRIHDSMWTIRLDEDAPDLPKGARIEITGIDGTTLCARSSPES